MRIPRLSSYARAEWISITIIGVLLLCALLVLKWWILTAFVLAATLAALLFFRDPDRTVPTQRGIIVAPVDGKIVSVHQVEHHDPFDGPAMCVRMFISLLDPHIARSPCHGNVTAYLHRDGNHRNALNPESLEENESVSFTLLHPIRDYPIARVRLIAGLIARTIVCPLQEGQTIQRGNKIGMIKLGSAAEVYIPMELRPTITHQVGQGVKAGETPLAQISVLESSTKLEETTPETQMTP